MHFEKFENVAKIFSFWQNDINIFCANFPSFKMFLMTFCCILSYTLIKWRQTASSICLIRISKFGPHRCRFDRWKRVWFKCTYVSSCPSLSRPCSRSTRTRRMMTRAIRCSMRTDSRFSSRSVASNCPKTHANSFWKCKMILKPFRNEKSNI